ncbi:MAG: anti-sigma factor, partial [Candidatus Aminicenantales bacterium]
MSDRKTERLVSELLKGDVPPEEEARVKALLRKKGTDAGRLTEYEDIWKALDEENVPEPSEAMHLLFRKTLEEAKKQSWRAESAVPARKNPRFRLGGAPQWAVGFSLVVIGWFIGFQLTPRPERA